MTNTSDASPSTVSAPSDASVSNTASSNAASGRAASVFTAALIEELDMLRHYNLSTTQTGVKVHKTASAAVRAATERLHKKGLITQIDGGYLTPLGQEAAEHLQNMLMIMTSA